jgi:hypothetical protein
MDQYLINSAQRQLNLSCLLILGDHKKNSEERVFVDTSNLKVILGMKKVTA